MAFVGFMELREIEPRDVIGKPFRRNTSEIVIDLLFEAAVIVIDHLDAFSGFIHLLVRLKLLPFQAVQIGQGFIIAAAICVDC